jgi:hypothetical protein
MLTARPALKNIGSLMPPFTDSQPQQTLHWELGLANKLNILCCWMIFRLIITMLFKFLEVYKIPISEIFGKLL